MTRHLTVSALAGLLLSMLVAPASAQTVPAAPTTVSANSQMVQDVASAVGRYANYSVFDDVSIQAASGVVTLTGRVTMPVKRDDIARRVAQVAGVVSVDDQIKVLPLSAYDDQLRFVIARRIYGNALFAGYASMANPPIHILVENGRITLSGVVHSESDRLLATALTASIGGFSVTNELRTDKEAQALLDAIA